MNLTGLLLTGIILLPVSGIILLLLWRTASKMQAAIIAIISEGFALIIPLMLLAQLKTGKPVTFSVPWIATLEIGRAHV